MKKKETKTLHEKKLELATASAPKYGIYIDGGSIDKMIEAIDSISPLILSILCSDSEEKTKRMAIDLIKNSIPGVENVTIGNVDIDFKD